MKEIKLCKNCGLYPKLKEKGHNRAICRKCFNLEAKRRRSENLELFRSIANKSRAKNKDKINSKRREDRKNNPEYHRAKGRQYDQKRVKQRRFERHNLSEEKYNELFVEQNRCCAICKSTHWGCGVTWHIDHDHSTDKVRGILCHYCNIMLGNAKDNPETLLSAIEYLKDPPYKEI